MYDTVNRRGRNVKDQDRNGLIENVLTRRLANLFLSGLFRI
jgi:hypothetical protein